MCETGSGSYYYRSERLSDGAQLRLKNATPAGGGFDVVNTADGSRYQVRPEQLTISSSGGLSLILCWSMGRGETLETPEIADSDSARR